MQKLGSKCDPNGRFQRPTKRHGKTIQSGCQENPIEWKETGDIRILTDKQIPTRVPFRKEDKTIAWT